MTQRDTKVSLVEIVLSVVIHTLRFGRSSVVPSSSRVCVRDFLQSVIYILRLGRRDDFVLTRLSHDFPSRTT